MASRHGAKTNTRRFQRHNPSQVSLAALSGGGEANTLHQSESESCLIQSARQPSQTPLTHPKGASLAVDWTLSRWHIGLSQLRTTYCVVNEELWIMPMAWEEWNERRGRGRGMPERVNVVGENRLKATRRLWSNDSGSPSIEDWIGWRPLWETMERYDAWGCDDWRAAVKRRIRARIHWTPHSDWNQTPHTQTHNTTDTHIQHYTVGGQDLLQRKLGEISRRWNENPEILENLTSLGYFRNAEFLILLANFANRRAHVLFLLDSTSNSIYSNP